MIALGSRLLTADNDISGGSFGIRQVKLTLNGAFNMLQEQLCQRAKTMVEDKEWHKAGEDDPEELTILGKVMGVTREVSYQQLSQIVADEQTSKHRQELHRLHREGRLQRLLDLSPDVPFAKQFPEAQELRDASTIDHSRKSKSASKGNGHTKSKHDSTPRRARHESPAVGAIEVEDDEVEFDDYSDAFDSENDANATFSEGSDNDDIEEIFPQIMGALKKSGKDRYQSVSEDSDEDDIKILEDDDEEEEEETRYSIKDQNNKSKTKSRSKSKWKTNIKSDTDDEEGEIHDTPPKVTAKKTDGLTKQQRKERTAKRKDFWAAKGVAEDEEEDDDEVEREEGEVVN